MKTTHFNIATAVSIRPTANKRAEATLYLKLDSFSSLLVSNALAVAKNPSFQSCDSSLLACVSAIQQPGNPRRTLPPASQVHSCIQRFLHSFQTCSGIPCLCDGLVLKPALRVAVQHGSGASAAEAPVAWCLQSQYMQNKAMHAAPYSETRMLYLSEVVCGHQVTGCKPESELLPH